MSDNVVAEVVAVYPNPAKPEPNFILMGTRPLAKSSP
jgi:hypothetical protein